jgi:hypothetical protein
MAITNQHSARPAANDPDRPATSQAGLASRTSVPVMGAADSGTVTPVMASGSGSASIPRAATKSRR